MNIKAIAILLTLDTLWVGKYMGPKYMEMIPRIQKENTTIRLLYAILAYVFMVIGLILFVLPNIRNGNIKDCIRYGFTFGVVLYGIYNFTNAAIFKNWDIKLAILDILWGGFVYFLSSYIGTK